MNRSMVYTSVRSCNFGTQRREQTSTCPGENGLWLIIAYTFFRSRKIWEGGITHFPKMISPEIFIATQNNNKLYSYSHQTHLQGGMVGSGMVQLASPSGSSELPLTTSKLARSCKVLSNVNPVASSSFSSCFAALQRFRYFCYFFSQLGKYSRQSFQILMSWIFRKYSISIFQVLTYSFEFMKNMLPVESMISTRQLSSLKKNWFWLSQPFIYFCIIRSSIGIRSCIQFYKNLLVFTWLNEPIASCISQIFNLESPPDETRQGWQQDRQRTEPGCPKALHLVSCLFQFHRVMKQLSPPRASTSSSIYQMASKGYDPWYLIISLSNSSCYSMFQILAVASWLTLARRCPFLRNITLAICFSCPLQPCISLSIFLSQILMSCCSSQGMITKYFQTATIDWTAVQCGQILVTQ